MSAWGQGLRVKSYISSSSFEIYGSTVTFSAAFFTVSNSCCSAATAPVDLDLSVQQCGLCSNVCRP